MKCGFKLALILAGCMAAASPSLSARAQNQGAKQQQTPADNAPPQAAPQPNADGNPFPGDVTSVPLMPSSETPDLGDYAAEAASPDAAPPADTDPVRSPEDAAPGNSGATEGFSSSAAGLDNLIPEPDAQPANSKNKKEGAVLETMPRETPGKDIDVGNYYMSNKNWRGALSRFQSALVLAPDNPDVYWGLAECYWHLGQYAEARANYEKVAEYDPDSRHGKDAKKALKDPQLANAGAAGAPPK